MQINRMLRNEEAVDSLQNKLKVANARTSEGGPSCETKLFPIGAKTSSAKYDAMRRDEKHINFRLSQADYKDFRVPV